jgi:hypothetical protein
VNRQSKQPLSTLHQHRERVFQKKALHTHQKQQRTHVPNNSRKQLFVPVSFKQNIPHDHSVERMNSPFPNNLLSAL